MRLFLSILRNNSALKKPSQAPYSQGGQHGGHMNPFSVTLGLHLNIWIPTSGGYYGKPWFLLFMTKNKISHWLEKLASICGLKVWHCSRREDRVNDILKWQLCSKRSRKRTRGKTSGMFIEAFIFIRVLLTVSVTSSSWTYKEILRNRSK